MSEQPDYSWQVNPNQSKQCPQCGGTGRVRIDASDPCSLLEWEKSVLLRKLDRCHEAMKAGIHIIQIGIRTRTDAETARPVLCQMIDAMTDRGDEEDNG